MKPLPPEPRNVYVATGEPVEDRAFTGAAPVSPSGSSAGWDWLVWLRRQKSVIKTFVSILGAFLLSLVPTGLDPNLQNGISIGLGLAVRAALDWIDFRLSEVPLEPRT